MKNNPIVIGVGGFARSGKDTFVKVARKILSENGYTSEKLAFADVLKIEIGPFLKQYYGVDVWTDDSSEKKLIRPLLVAHGCQKRIQTNGIYWVDKVEEQIQRIVSVCDVSKHVIFISDCRFPNEVSWVHDWQKLRWSGWFVHLKKYSVNSGIQYDSCTGKETGYREWKQFDEAPNDEEAKNDPICEKESDYRLELENVIEREQRVNGIKITTDSLLDNTYLNEEIKLCLTKCPFLTIK